MSRGGGLQDPEEDPELARGEGDLLEVSLRPGRSPTEAEVWLDGIEGLIGLTDGFFVAFFCIRQWILNQLDLRPYLEPDFDIPTIRHFLSLQALHEVLFFLSTTHL